MQDFFKNTQAKKYQDISPFYTPKFNQWGINPTFAIKAFSSSYYAQLSISSSYGERTSFYGDVKEKSKVSNWIEADIEYRYFFRKKKRNLYLSFISDLRDLEIIPEEDRRKGLLTLNFGIGYQPSYNFNFSFGLSGNNRLFVKGIDAGIYLNSSYNYYQDKFEIETRAYLFIVIDTNEYYVANRKKGDYTIRLENEFRFKIYKGLNFIIESYIYRDNRIGGFALSIISSFSLEILKGDLS